ncbi:hypothetical protein A2810_03330 [candidate division Kazan bacterium RIFCSPHIGHO2_01_FULL_49_10]|uniref:Histidine phosphatase family protein n=1 Tax=candidate division Kazan bacterium RIFCSPLOWO2_01_FULL_48_13 TaxID=1798539 RepID=A0A1F4PNU2_UNCK3|nr:MAG: hypothetical protein A2810_03330 [candidate division Kazan bacterium RIFCSPHIGHO2_01_FULL_49_10]OGB85513.1 MAG: hypothetical protein A2994_00615 [candidate division Kazan bacterium RIFCSPLOWO2_01_FULL_48_13]
METTTLSLVPESLRHLLPPVGKLLETVPSPQMVYIVRHATPHDYTTGSRLQKVYGTHARQVWLSSEGIDEANCGRDYICREVGRVRAVIHSPLPRAKQTADILMGYYIVNPPSFISDVRLEDIRLGPWLDIPRQDWSKYRSLYWEEQLKSHGRDGEPENPCQTQQRVVESFFEHIQKDSNGLPLLFVFHGDPICFLFQYLLSHDLMHLVDYRVMSDGESQLVGKCTIWQVRLSLDRPVEIKLMFNPQSV